MTARNGSFRRGVAVGIGAGLVLGVFIAGITALPAQEKPPIPAPPAADPPDNPPKKVLDTKPRKQVDTEIVPPVKIGAELETTADGVHVGRVVPGSAADEAGLKAG